MHYNDPDLSARDFLHCVMHDPALPIRDRMRAAKALSKLPPPPPPPPPPTLTIRIAKNWQFCTDMWEQWEAFSAEMEAYRLSLPPHEQKEIVDAVNRCMRRNELGIDLLREDTVIKGHA